MTRPNTIIDWNKVEEMAVAGCIGTEIAGWLGIHPDTLYRRVEEELGMGFTAYLQEKRSIGDGLIRKKQYEKALGLSDKGDNTLLIWLGKNRLKQQENAIQAASEEEKERHKAIMDQLSALQSASNHATSKDSKVDKS
jgi:hypothetical protein